MPLPIKWENMFLKIGLQCRRNKSVSTFPKHCSRHLAKTSDRLFHFNCLLNRRFGG
jgi:hypothetical protein